MKQKLIETKFIISTIKISSPSSLILKTIEITENKIEMKNEKLIERKFIIFSIKLFIPFQFNIPSLLYFNNQDLTTIRIHHEVENDE